MKHNRRKFHSNNHQFHSLVFRVRCMRLHNENNKMIDLVVSVLSDSSLDPILRILRDAGLFDFIHQMRRSS
jgi:hypothetical protein